MPAPALPPAAALPAGLAVLSPALASAALCANEFAVVPMVWAASVAAKALLLPVPAGPPTASMPSKARNATSRSALRRHRNFSVSGSRY